MLARLFEVTTPFRWAKRDYAAGDLIELLRMSHLRHKTIAGKVKPYNIDSARAKAIKTEAPPQAAVIASPGRPGPATTQRAAAQEVR